MSKSLEAGVGWESSMLAFMHRQLWVKQPASTPKNGTQFASQTAIVTGSNVGLGFESSRQLLALGLSTLIVAVRSITKGEAAASALRTEFPGVDVRVWMLDMASYDSITAFTRRCDKELDRLDIVILNAGVAMNDFQISSVTGHELVLQVNYLSTALLAILLLPIVRKRRERLNRAGDAQLPPARLSFAGSDTVYWSVLNSPAAIQDLLNQLGDGRASLWEQFDQPEGYNMDIAYQRSKVLLLAFVARLAEGYVNPDEVVINCVNPGLSTESTFLRDGVKPTKNWFLNRLSELFLNAFSRPIAVAASNYIDAVLWKGKESHGSFVSDWAIKPYPAIGYSKEGQAFLAKVWDETLGELKFAGVESILNDMKK
ncbi:hypothetical protein V8F06_004195 [Rhypophila decipiens]